MRRLVAAVTVGAVLLVAGGCSGDDDKKASAPKPKSTTSTSSTSTTVPTCQPVPESVTHTIELSMKNGEKLTQVQSFKSPQVIGGASFIAGRTPDGAIAVFIRFNGGSISSVNDEARNRSTLPAARNITLDTPGAKQAAGCSVNAAG